MSATPSHRDVSSLLTEIELQTFDVSQHEWSLAETRALLRLATKTATTTTELRFVYFFIVKIYLCVLHVHTHLLLLRQILSPFIRNTHKQKWRRRRRRSRWRNETPSEYDKRAERFSL